MFPDTTLFSQPGKNAVYFQATPDLEQARSFQILPVDPLYHFRLHRLYDQGFFLIICVPQETDVITQTSPLWERYCRPSLIFRLKDWLFYCAKLALMVSNTSPLESVDVLFLESRKVLPLQFPDILQTIQGISGKPIDRLSNDHINVSVHVALDHTVKYLPFFVPVIPSTA